MEYFKQLDFKSKPIQNEVDCFFTKKQLEEMSDYEKNRYKNLRENYEMMVLMGLPVKKPSFMTAKWKRKRSVEDSESEKESDEEWTPNKSSKKKSKNLKPVPRFQVPYKTISSTATSTVPIKTEVKIPRKPRIISCTVNKSTVSQDEGKENKKDIKSKPEPRYPLRKRDTSNYMNIEVPDDDEFIYCEECNMEYGGDCPVHGSYNIIENKQVEESVSKKDKNRCFMTAPDCIEIKQSNIPNAGLGTFASKTIPNRSRFGPYGGDIIKDTETAHNSGYCWQIYQERKHQHFVDAKNPATSNWMRFVNCARTESEQNVTAYQYGGEIYYRTFKEISPGSEILVWYGNEYGADLGINRPLWSKSTFVAYHENMKKRKTFTTFPWRLNGAKPAIEDVYPCPFCQMSLAVPNLLLKHLYLRHYDNINIKKLLTLLNGDVKSIHHLSKIQSQQVLELIQNDKELDSNISLIICNENVSPLNTKPNSLSRTKNKHTGEKPYKCDVCSYSCNEAGNLQNHMRTHTGEKPYKCDVCSYSCNQAGHLQTHMRTHTGEKPYKCDVCSFSCIQSCHLQTHMRTHTGEKPYKCDLCSYSCGYSNVLQNHMRTHTGEKPYKCDVCSYSCNLAGNLQRHMTTHTGEKPYKCEVCSFSCNVAGNLQTHMRTHTGEKPYKCEVCSFSCGYSNVLQNHMRTHTGEKPYKCDVCSFSCNLAGNLQRHMRTHTGEKPYKCDVCSYSCNQAGHLQTHMRTHTGEKPYKCDVCSFSCIQNSDLRTHMRTHTGEKPYKCDVCSFSCNRAGSLQNHMRTHTGEKPYKCDVCSYSCNQAGNLQTHMRTHTGEKPYKCDICNEMFISSSNRSQHRKKKHGC